MPTEVKKVGVASQKPTKAEKPKKAAPEGEEEDKGRPEFDITTAIDASGNAIGLIKDEESGENQLTAIPANWDFEAHKVIPRSSFAQDNHFKRYRANVLRLKAKRLTETAARLEVEAENIERFGNDEQRKQANKMAKQRAAFIEYFEGLKRDGVTLSAEDEQLYSVLTAKSA